MYTLILLESENERNQVTQWLHEQLSKWEKIGFQPGEIVQGDGKIVWTFAGEYREWQEAWLPFVVTLLSEYIIEKREKTWMDGYIQNTFQFKVKEEIDEILEVVHAILDGERPSVPGSEKFMNRIEHITSAMAHEWMVSGQLHLDAFIRFRLGEYHSCLLQAIECAIDEYQWEQEYQAMIETFRQYVSKTPALIQTVHVIYGATVRFFDGHHREINTSARMAALRSDLVFERGLLPEEMVVSPLVSLAPEFVHVYTDTDEHGILQTLQAVFQERLFTHSLSALDSQLLRSSS